MSGWSAWWLRVRAIFDREALNRELEDEVQFHLEHETEANLQMGMTGEAAARKARLDFGGVQLAKEELRSVRGDSLVESAWQDARFGLRMLRRNPLFTAIAVATLALGLGANTAMFSVIDAVLLRPLPYSDPDRLVRVEDSNLAKGFPRFSSSPANFLDWRAQARSFSGMAAVTGDALTLSGEGEAQRLNVLDATPDFFTVMGIQTVLGRAFSVDEGTPGRDRVVVLSYHLWQQHFGGSRDVLGRSLRLDGENYTVIGVSPPEFRFGDQDVVVPLAFGPNVATQRGAHYLSVFARLKSGVPFEQANQEMKTIAARLAVAYPDRDGGWSAHLLPMQEYVVGRVRPAMLMLFGAVGFLALIACANVANLLLARAVRRQREISVRAALGASRGRIVRQLLAESLVLCSLGAAFGLILAWGGVAALRRLGPADVPRLATAQLDFIALAFTAGLTLLSTVLFGVFPTLRSSRVDVNAALKSATRGAAGSREAARPRNLLVFGEFALSVMLLIGAGLLIRSFIKLNFTPSGFQPDHVLTFNLSLPQKKYATVEQINAFYAQLLDKLKTLPGASSVGAVNVLPASGGMYSSTFTIQGVQVAPANEPSADLRTASRDYYRTLGIPLLRGRSFAATDIRGGQPVLVISEAMARKFWPQGDAIGHVVHMGVRPGASKDDTQGEIVGIVGDVRDFGLDIEPLPTVYALMEWPANRYASIVIKTASDPASLGGAARAVVAGLDPDLPVGDLQLMDDVLAASLAERRFYMLLLSLFAALALVLASTGLYGVISYSVSSRTQEIGIRMALGARPVQVLAMILRHGLPLALLGLAAGIAGALALGSVMKKMLFGIGPADAGVFLLVAGGSAVVALIACLVPARRATAVNPVTALRYE